MVELRGYSGGFSAYYQAGMTGKDIKAVKSTYANDLPTNFRQIAYDAGVRDAAASLRARSAGADSTVVHNDGQWVIENEYSESMNKDDVQVLSGVAQAIGKKIIFEDLGSDNGYYDADTGIIHLDIHAEDPLLDVMAHEVTHVMEDMAPVEHGRYRDFVMNAMAERLGIDTTALINGKKAEYASGGRTLSDEQAMNELVAEYTKQMMKDRNLFEAYAKKDLTGAQKLLEAFKRFLQKVKNLFQGNRQAQDAAVRERYGVSMEVAEEAARLWDEALNAVVAQAKGENENTDPKADVIGTDGVRCSLKKFSDGRRFVDLNIDQEQFDGMSVAEINAAAKKIIKKKFSGQVVGIDNPLFVNGNSAEKHVYFSPGTDEEIIEAKARTATELDNLIDAGTNFRTKPDGEDGHIHPDAVNGFSYFDTIFKVGDEYYEGVINFKNNAKGRLYHGVTKTRNITEDIHASYGKNPTSIFLRDVSMTIVHPNVGVVKTASDADGVTQAKGENRNTTHEGGGQNRHSIKGKSFTEDKYYARQMDNWDELADGSRVKVGIVRGGSALNRVGLPAAGMYFDVGKIRKAMGKHEDHLLPDILKGIPDLLNDPIVITEYRGPNGDIDNTVSVYGNLFLPDGNTPVVVGIVMHLDRSGQNVITNIRTVHARSDFAKHITDATVLYLNEDKKKTRNWFQVCGILNVPLEGTRYGLIRSISFIEKNSNSFSLKTSVEQRLEDEDGNGAGHEAKGENKNTTHEGGGNVRASAKRNLNKVQQDVTSEYEKLVDAVLNGTYNGRDAVIMGYTPEIYQDLGMPSLPFVIGAGHIYSAAKSEAEAKNENRFNPKMHYHGLGDRVVKNLYAAVQNPIMIIAAKDIDHTASPMRSTHSIVAIIDIGTADKSLLLPIELTAERSVDGAQMDVNVLSSAYQKNVKNLVSEAIARENAGDVGVYYTTKEAASLPVDGVQFPVHLAAATASNHIIHRFPEKINLSIKKPTQSIQFKRWFGDWQNNPKKVSVVVDDQNEPLVVYHGTGADIDEFKPEFTGKGNDQYGTGYYFTTSEETANRYASGDNANVIPAYLNIRRPLVLNGSTTPNLYGVAVTPKQAAGIIAHHPEIMDKEISVLGDFFEEYWETGPSKDMVRRLGREYDWSIGSLETDIFRDYPEVFHAAVKQVLGYDGVQVNLSDGSKHYVAWFSNQIKHATENIGTFSATDNRIRRSRKGDTVLDTAVARAEEAEALKQQIAYWKGQLKRTKGFQVDQKAVDKVAKGLIRTYQVDTDADELSAKLKTMYDGIATGYYGDTEIDYETYKARAEEVARLIVENAVETENEMYVEYAELRKYLRSITLNISPEDSQDIPDFGDFRKRNWGRMTIGSKGTNIDQVYKELSELWPEFFNEERETSPSDQLLRIAEVMEAVYRSQEVNPFGQYAEEAVSDIADEVMGYFFTIPQAVTFADKAAAKLKQARADATLAGQMAQGRKDAAALRRTEERATATQQKLKDTLETERGQNVARLKQARADATLAGQMAQGRKDAALLRSAEERMAAAQQRAKDALRKERERGAKVMQDLKDRQSAKDTRTREQRKAAELRGKIVRHAKALSKKLLSPTDKKHVPDELQSAVAAVLDAINLESNRDGAEKTTKRTQAFQKLRDAYKKVAGAVVVDPALFSGEGDQATAGSLLEAVLDMGDTRIADMNSEQLTTVWQVLKAVEASVRSADRLLAAKKYQHISEMAEQLQSDNALRRPKKSGKRGNNMLLDLEIPKTFFHKYGEVGDALFRELRNAQDNQQRMTDEIAEAVKEIVTPKQVQEMQKTVHEIKTESGDTLYLTTAHIMEMYLLSKREQAQDHLLKGGVVQPEIQSEKIQRGTDMIRLSLTDMGNITGKLTQEQTRIADALQQLMTTKLADYGNAASMKAYGYKKFTGKDYWPIKSAQEALHSKVEKGANNTRSIKNIGLAQQVVPHANTAVDLGGIFQTFSSHATDMIDYAAWLCPMEDVNRLFNFKYKDGKGIPTGKTVKGILDRVGGSGSQAYWSNLMEDIQNGIAGPGDTAFGNRVARVTSNVKGASVGANVRVIVQQPTAIIRATAVMNPAYLALGGKGVTKGSGWKKALKYAEIAQRKNRGGFEISNPMQMSEILFDDRTGIARFNDAMQKGAAAADALTWGCIWNACEHQAKHETNLEAGTEAFYKKVAEVFTEVIEESQVVDGVLQRSQIMRSSNQTAKQMTSFMGESTMSLNMFLRAYDAWRYEQNGPKKAKAGRTLARVGATLVATDLLTALAQSLIDAIRDDDKDKKYWERFWNAFTGLDGDEETFWEHVSAIYLSGNAANTVSVIGKMPYAKDFKSLVQGYSVERLDISGIADLIDAGGTVVDNLKGEGARTWPYTVKQLATAGSKLFGISASNILRDVWGIARGVAVETGNIEVQYEMEKAIYNIANEKNKGRFYDILFSALKQGDIENYNIIRKDLMTEMGLAGNNIDSAMKERYTKALKNDPGMSFPQQSRDVIGIFAKYNHSEPEEKFGADNLDADAYTAYSKQLANDRREIMDGLEADPIFRGADDKFKDAATSAARKLVEEQTLEDHSDGQYETTTQWIKYAEEAEAKGIEPCSYALFRAAYTTTEGEEKSDKIRDWLEDNRTLTESQREFLWSTVYKSEW